MRGLRRTEKFKTDKPSNQNRSESDGEPAKPKGRPGRAREPSARRTVSGRTEEQRAEYRNLKERMETGVRSGESRGRESGSGAPKEPLPGEIGKQGKAGAES